MKGSSVKDIKEWLRIGIGAALLTAVLKTVAFATYYIPSESMVPTLQVGDRLIASKFDYGYGRYSPAFFDLPQWAVEDGRIFPRLPERGDIVIFAHPRTGETLVKRVIGLPGDRVQLSAGRLILNGKAVERQYLRTYAYRQDAGAPVEVREYAETLPGGRTHSIILQSENRPQENTGVFRVPQGHLFVMGDNRDNSADSRFESLGFVPVENLIGRSRAILFSLHACTPEPGLSCAGRRYLSALE
nr:signal peptidase I [Afifella sp. IM 167]